MSATIHHARAAADAAPAVQRGTAFLFDLDGTVTQDELLPLIAEAAGLQEEMRILTDLTLSGAIDFRQSFKLRVALLSTVPLTAVHAALDRVRVDHHIGNFLRSRPEDAYVVTGNLDLWIRPLLDRLGVQAYTSTGSHDGHRITLHSILNKADAARELRPRYRRLVAVGDSFNDIPMFENADLGIAYAGTHAPVPALVRISRFVVKDSASLCHMLTTL